jgi:hypothetical protein
MWTVVRSDENQGVLELVGLAQRLEQAGHHLIEFE